MKLPKLLWVNSTDSVARMLGAIATPDLPACDRRPATALSSELKYILIMSENDATWFWPLAQGLAAEIRREIGR